MYSTPINRNPSPAPYYGGTPAPYTRPSDGQNYYGGSPMAPVPVRPLSRAPSPMPTMAGRPISRGPSPVPPGMGRAQDIGRSTSTSNFQIEKAPKSPGPYGRPSISHPDGYSRDEQVYRQQVAALIAAKDRQIAATGRLPASSTQLVLFFRTKVRFFIPYNDTT